MATTDIHAKSEFRFAIAEESTWATAITTQSNFRELMITDVPQIEYGGIIRDEAKKSDGKRVLSHTDVFLQTAGGEYTVAVSGIITEDTVDLLVYGVMQDIVSESDSGTCARVFEWDGSSTGVDSNGKPNQSYTLNGYNPASDESWSLKGAVIKSLSISGDPGSNGGRLSFSATFYSGYAPTQTGLTVTPSSWTSAYSSSASDFFIFQKAAAKTIGGTAVVLGSFSLNWENNAKRIGHDSSGNPEYYAYSGGGNDFVFTGEMSAKYDANSKDEIAIFLADPGVGSAEKQIIFAWGSASADGYLKFDVNAIYTGNSMDFGGDAVMINLPFQGVDDGTNEVIEVTIENSNNRGWI